MNKANDDICASVLVAAYEHPDFLRRTLLGLTRQSEQRFEVVVCDDGSGESVSAVVAELSEILKQRLKHCRHEKDGFRKCRILNEGIAASESDYLVFLDADCIPRSRFVEQHLRLREQGAYLVGRRVHIGRRVTSRLTDDAVLSGRIESVAGLAMAGSGIRHAEEGIPMPVWMGRLFRRDVPPLKGCNFSCWKADMVKINGFDEQFVTPGGGEDDDVERRLKLIGLRAKSVRNAAICYHQHHQVVPRGSQGVELCSALARGGRSTCERGLNEHEGRAAL